MKRQLIKILIGVCLICLFVYPKHSRAIWKAGSMGGKAKKEITKSVLNKKIDIAGIDGSIIRGDFGSTKDNARRITLF